MQQPMRSNRDSMPSSAARPAPMIVRTDLSSLLNEYTSSQRRYDDRLESLEREMASLKGQVSQVYTSEGQEELNRTFTTKRAPASARATSPSRIPLPITPRKPPMENSSVASGKTGTVPHSSSPPIAMPRSKTFHNGTSLPPSANFSDENNLVRSYKTHLEQVLRKEGPPGAEMKVPNYTCVEDVVKANEQLLLENERLRSELNRLKTESIVLLRSMKNVTGSDISSGNERITAERERQELAVELARQVEENKRLRKSLLAQSEKFLTLRQSAHPPDVSRSIANDQRQTPETASQTSLKSIRTHQSKSARHNSDNRGYVRPRAFYHGAQDPL